MTAFTFFLVSLLFCSAAAGASFHVPCCWLAIFSAAVGASFFNIYISAHCASPRFRITPNTQHGVLLHRIASHRKCIAGSDGGAAHQGADKLRGSGCGGFTITGERGRGPRRDTIRQENFPPPPAHPASPRRPRGGGDPQTIAKQGWQAFRPRPPPASAAGGSAEYSAWCRFCYRGSSCWWWCCWRCFCRRYHLGIVFGVVFVKQNRARGCTEKRTQQRCCSRWGSEKAGGWPPARGLSPKRSQQ